MIPVLLDPSIRGELKAGVAWFHSVSALETNPHWHEMEELAAALRNTHQGKKPSEIPGLAPARALYRRFGMDPTRHRPSSEALLRRVLKGQELHQVNRVVDAVNWASMDMLLPIGLYDTAKTRERLVLRRGRAGETYPGIRRGEIHVENRLVAADTLGACGSPTADSLRTSVSPDTTEVVAVVFAPSDFPTAQLKTGLERFAGKVTAWCGGTIAGRRVLEPKPS